MIKWSVALAICCAGVAAGACRASEPASAPREPAVVWRRLGAWSGHGSTQTEPFISETGSLRVRWETKAIAAAAPATGARTAVDGRFRVVVHSDVSGRSLGTAVETTGTGHDTVFFSEDPRPFFLAVESEHLEWTLAVEEPVATTYRRP